MTDLQLPVLIIGAGPVGLSLAVALYKKGIPFEVFEALEELSPEARASTFHPPTLEMFAEWGVVDDVLRQGHRVSSLQYWERSSWELIAKFDYRAIEQDTAYPFRLQCPQSTLTRVIKAHLDEQMPGHIHMNHKLISFSDSGTCVEAVFETQHGIVQRKGAYLCGADGSRSTVRGQLNLPFEGMTYADGFLLIACDLDFKSLYPNMGSVLYIFDPEEWVIVMQLPDVTRVVFQLKEHEDEQGVRQPDVIYERVRRFTKQDVSFNIFGISTYRVHQRVADTFRVGNVLLLGDAAHINNPMGGMGMNSGIHDAHCLADKLEKVMQGGDVNLLDVYNAERRAYALNSVRQRTHQNYEDMAADEAVYREQRNQRFRDIANDPAKHRAYLLQSSMLEERIAKAVMSSE